MLEFPDFYAKKFFSLARILALDQFTATTRTEEDKRIDTIALSKNPLFLANPAVEPDMTDLNSLNEEIK